MYIIIKKGVGKDYIDEKINITNLSYEETYNILQEKINDIDLLITSKIKYNMHYSKLIKTTYNKEPLTFSDSKIYYPNLLENPTFYSYYLLRKITFHHLNIVILIYILHPNLFSHNFKKWIIL